MPRSPSAPPAPPAPPSTRPTRAPELGRLLLHMMLWVFALHGTAIAIYRLAGVDAAEPRLRTGFTVVWMVATFALVSVYLRRIRALRRQARRRALEGTTGSV